MREGTLLNERRNQELTVEAGNKSVNGNQRVFVPLAMFSNVGRQHSPLGRNCLEARESRLVFLKAWPQDHQLPNHPGSLLITQTPGSHS